MKYDLNMNIDAWRMGLWPRHIAPNAPSYINVAIARRHRDSVLARPSRSDFSHRLTGTF